MEEFYSPPTDSCSVCGKAFDYTPNPNWPALKQFFKLNPSRGFWLAKEHSDCAVKRQRTHEEEKEAKTRFLRNEEIKRAMTDLGFPKILNEKPFEQFHVEPGNKQAHDALQRWTYSKTGILLYGPPGRGKSHLSAAFAKKWIDMGMNVVFQNVSSMLALLRKGYDDDLFDERLRLISSRAQILVLDDLGAEKPTAWGEEKIYMIIDTRLSEGLPLFITTNCSEKELEDKFHPRVISRLKEVCTWFEVGGRDWRSQIKQNREAEAARNPGRPGQGPGFSAT
jgi:DNA replication protein DnaC